MDTCSTTRLLWLLCLLPALWLAGPLAADPRPNIAVFIMDDVGQRDIGAFGNPAVQTPNIDRLAAEGIRFTQAFLTTSSCTASRASILTGLYPHSTGAPGLHDTLPATVDSLPLQLKRAGYYTASIGKWHLGEPFKSHFDRVVDMREHTGSADWLPELAKRPHSQPFFFWFASLDAHTPYDWHKPLLIDPPDEVIVPPWSTDSDYERRMLALYYHEIARVDGNIGKVIDALRREGMLDNTLVVVLSDNGAIFGGAKTTLYDEGLLTPLILRYPPRIAAGLANSQLVSSIDLAPTLLALAGAPVPEGMDGVSLWPTIADPQHPVRDYIYAERNRQGPDRYFERAIRTREFLYKRNYNGRRLCDPLADTIFGDKPRDSKHRELYHIPSDPLAQHDLSELPQYHELLTSLRQVLNITMHVTHDDPPPLVMEQCPLRPWHERIQFPQGWRQ